MKTIKLASCLYYLTVVEGIDWRTKDYAANRSIKLIKGNEFAGKLELTSGGKYYSFSCKESEKFLNFFTKLLAPTIKKWMPNDCCVVPIPNSSVTKDVNDFRTKAIAEKIIAASNLNINVEPVLRWHKAHEPYRAKKKFRDPYELYDNLNLLKKPSKNVIIFDDVTTSGSHLKAACWKLLDADANIEKALVMGTSTREQYEKMIGWTERDFDVERDQDWFEF